MGYHLFLHYGWFLQNYGKDFIRTNMHTNVQCTMYILISSEIRYLSIKKNVFNIILISTEQAKILKKYLHNNIQLCMENLKMKKRAEKC